MKDQSVLSESPIVILPSLAKQLGLTPAVVVQQIRFLLAIPGSGKVLDGKKWIWNTYEQWQKDHFPFLSLAKIKRVFDMLETNHVVESCQPDGYKSRKKYYRLNEGMLLNLTAENAARISIDSICDDGPIDSIRALPSAQNETMEGSKMRRSSTENTAETTAETTILEAHADMNGNELIVKRTAKAPTQPPKPLPPSVEKVYLEFLQHRKECKKPVTPTAQVKQREKLSEMGEERAKAALDYSIANGWQGIFEPPKVTKPPEKDDQQHWEGDFYGRR